MIMSEGTPTKNTTTPKATRTAHRVCPWYLGYFLASPLRRIVEHPEHLLQGLVRPGMTVLEPGCGMGFFSLPLARLVGPGGRVICVDLQRKMIDGLRRRARRAGLLDRLETAVCGPSDLGAGGWTGRVDLALAIHVVHEVPDGGAFLQQIHAALRPGGTLLILEPKGHVSAPQFQATIAAAEAAGFVRGSAPPSSRGFGILLSKPDSGGARA
jgi:2-polyprenyl-3-methyl-5-hydroxy-6-metoxy-1,4-benzoquinol methylase